MSEAPYIQIKWRPVLVGSKPFRERVVLQGGGVMVTRRSISAEQYAEHRQVLDDHFAIGALWDPFFKEVSR